MCDFGISTALAALGSSGAATAAGSTAAATASAASTLSTIGSLVTAGGAVIQGIQTASAARTNARLIEQQKQQQAQIDATKSDRERKAFQSQIAQQRAELATRGVQLDSATAVLLGQTAAAEMSFNTQALRASAQATQDELTAQQVAYRSQATQALFKGGLSAAGTLLDQPADQWAELLT